jgi:hypothetical protein
MWYSALPYVQLTSNRIPAGLAAAYLGASTHAFKPGLPALVNRATAGVYTIQLKLRPRLINLAAPGYLNTKTSNIVNVNMR